MNEREDNLINEDQEVIDLNNREVLNNFLNKEDNQKEAVQFALLMRKHKGREWFTLKEVLPLMSKGTTIDGLRHKIHVVGLFGLFKRKKIGNKIKYRVHLSALEKYRLSKKK